MTENTDAKAVAARKPAARKPAAAKAPQDHKPAVTAKTEATQEDVTVTAGGRDWTLNTVGINDFELIPHLNNVGGGGSAAVSSMPVVMLAFLGQKQYVEALDMLRNEAGIVEMNAGIEFVLELVAADPNS